MRSASIARKYAAALLKQAGSTKEAESFAAALEALALVIKRTPALVRVSGHPGVSLADKQALMASAAEESTKVFERFLNLLIRRRYVAVVPEIAREFRLALNRSQGIHAVDVTSAQPLNEAQTKHLDAVLAKQWGSK